MAIFVEIAMDNVPSKDNKRVMHYLLSEVGQLRQMFSIRVNLIKRTVKNRPEAAIKIGENKAVAGYSRIIPELKAAASRAREISSSGDEMHDYINKFLHSSASDESNSGTNLEKEMSSAFTVATSEREKRNQLQKASRPGKAKPGESPELSRPATSVPQTRNQGRTLPTMKQPDVPSAGDNDSNPRFDSMATKKYSAQLRETRGDIRDNSDLAAMAGDDPHYNKFWANQFVTEGI